MSSSPSSSSSSVHTRSRSSTFEGACAPLPPANVAISAMDQLTVFLQHAPSLFSSPLLPPLSEAPIIIRLHLPLPHHNEPVACIRDASLPADSPAAYLISGTDILRVLLFRFRCLARPIPSMKKFEEGVFSDLRNLKAGVAARLEPARSPFLEMLYRFGCVRTQKRQKVFYWSRVDHDRLFRDVWEREERRERESTQQAGDTPLVSLDLATSETAAVWHRTRPLLITYVSSSDDSSERPLNAADVSINHPMLATANIATATATSTIPSSDIGRTLLGSSDDPPPPVKSETGDQLAFTDAAKLPVHEVPQSTAFNTPDVPSPQFPAWMLASADAATQQLLSQALAASSAASAVSADPYFAQDWTFHRSSLANFAQLSLDSPVMPARPIQQPVHSLLMAELEAFLTPPKESVTPAADDSMAFLDSTSVSMRLGIAQLCAETESSASNATTHTRHTLSPSPRTTPATDVTVDEATPCSTTPWPIPRRTPTSASNTLVSVSVNQNGKRDRVEDCHSDIAVDAKRVRQEYF